MIGNKNTIIKWLLEQKEDIEFTIDLYKEIRSNNANAYFHSLVNKIAKTMGKSEDEVKIKMVLDYGTIMINDNEENIGFKLPKGTDVSRIYKYAKWFDTRVDNGKEFDCYIIYEHTHLYNKKDMSVLISGVVQEAKDLGIQTLDDIKINKLIESWGKKC